MATVGIMHSASEETAQKSIAILRNRLQTDCTTAPTIKVLYASRDNPLPKIAQHFIDNNVELLIAAGGSRSADAAIKKRGNANKPIIVFTSVAPYICSNINKNTTTPVFPHNSCHALDI